MSFFYISLEQIYDDKREQIKYQAISSRGAQLEKFDEFLKEFDKKKEQSDEVDCNVRHRKKRKGHDH